MTGGESTHKQDIEALMVRFMSRATEDSPDSAKDLRQYVLQLPLWEDHVRSAPNEILRSALFSPKNRHVARRFYKDMEIAHIGDFEIRYTGEELRQDDEAAWLQILHLSRGKPLGAPVEFKPSAFLRAVGRCANRKPSARDHDWLIETITRFTATALVVQSSRLKSLVGLSLVRRFTYQDENGSRLALWRVWIEPEMAQLFGGIYYSYIEWQMRLQLPTGLCTWLMGFLSTHRNPYPVKIDTIRQVVSAAEAKRFKRTLVSALDELVRVGFLSSYAIEKGVLMVVRNKQNSA